MVFIRNKQRLHWSRALKQVKQVFFEREKEHHGVHQKN